MLLNAIPIAFLLVLITAGIYAVNKPRECPCKVGDEETFGPKLWLDVIFMVDASDAVGSQNFASLVELMKTFVNGVNIGQQGQVSRVAVATFTSTVTTHADLTTFTTKAAALQTISSLKYTGGSTANLRSAVLEAQNIIDRSDNRKNAQNLIVLMTAHGFDCNTETQVLNDNPCQVAKTLTTRGEILQIISIGLAGTNVPVINFNTPCYYLTNSADMIQKFLFQSCQANCFCKKPFTQFRVEKSDVCTGFGECVYKMDIPVGYYAAEIGCQLEKLSLADVYSSDKQNFLDGLAGSSFPYWTGMRLLEDGKTYMWENNAQKVLTGDYSKWIVRNETQFGGCPATQWNVGQSATGWKSEKCAWDQPSYFYFCQTKTCDVDNYCDSERL